MRSHRGLSGGESPEVVYLGRHHFESRTAQGYVIGDLMLQIEAGLASDAMPRFAGRMTSLQAASDRDDGYGRRVRDIAVLEMSARKPRIELFSVIPRGDGRQKRQSPEVGALSGGVIHRVTCIRPTADHLDQDLSAARTELQASAELEEP